MTITTLAQLQAAPKQRINFTKTSNQAADSVNNWLSNIGLGGSISGTLAGSNTTTGLVPVANNNTGYPLISTFGSGATGYLSNFVYSGVTAGSMQMYDCLWKGGAFSASTSYPSITSASFASRVPSGTDFTGLELWYQVVTAGNTASVLTITYKDENAVSKTISYSTTSGAAQVPNGCIQIPIITKGISGISAVQSSSTTGTYNILIMRKIAGSRSTVSGGDPIDCTLDILSTGLARIYQTSALCFLQTCGASGVTGIFNVKLEIANG